MTHDPPFVKHANPQIPLIHATEHPIIEAMEMMNLIESFDNLPFHFSTPSQLIDRVQVSSVPDFAIVDHIDQPYIRETLSKEFMPRYYTHEKEFYWSMERSKEMNYKYRTLWKSK